MCNCNNRATIDMRTPRNVHLSAFYRRSFAYDSVKTRMPAILDMTIGALVQDEHQLVTENGEEACNRLKVCILELEDLKDEIASNKQLRNISFDRPDAKVYNDYLVERNKEETLTTFFHTIWLLSECYVYRRIYEALELTSLTNIDPFRQSKLDSFSKSMNIVDSLASHIEKILQPTVPADRKKLTELLKLLLWGNKYDLSLTVGIVHEGDTLLDIDKLEPFILCNHYKEIWATLADESAKSSILDIVLDNAGYEVFADLCLADYLTTKKIVSKVRFYVKTIPWYVSDCMVADIHWIIDQLLECQGEGLVMLGERWRQYLADGVWTLEEYDFWTYPVDFSYMSKLTPELYLKLAEARLIIFKGDLNYRKLFGEKNWTPGTSLEAALNGFHPAPLCVIRTIKSEVLCGISNPDIVDKIDAQDPNWMRKGDYGVIQYCGRVDPL